MLLSVVEFKTCLRLAAECTLGASRGRSLPNAVRCISHVALTLSPPYIISLLCIPVSCVSVLLRFCVYGYSGIYTHFSIDVIIPFIKETKHLRSLDYVKVPITQYSSFVVFNYLMVLNVLNASERNTILSWVIDSAKY